MNDVLWDIFWIVLVVLFCLCVAFLIFIIIIGIIDICNVDKPKKKYYLIQYRFSGWERETIIKAQSPLKAKLKFYRKYKHCAFISIEEIKDE